MRAARLIVFLLAACGGGEPSPITTPNNPGGGGGGGGGGGDQCAGTTTAVSVTDNVFTPSCTKVPPGSTVTWTFNAGAQHNVTFTNTSLGASADMTQGEYSKTFPNAGTFGYSCTRHPGMSGSVVVQ